MWNVLFTIAVLGCCSACIPNCVRCNSGGNNCEECNLGFFLLNKVCYQCSSHCHKCSSELSCTECTSGYYLNNSECSQCFATCLTCSHSTDHCTSCHSQDFLSNGVCLPCGTYCTSCSNGTCDKCEDGYYGRDCMQSCYGPCIGKVCDSTGKCTNGCDIGYYELSVGCANCPKNCTSCQNGQECTNCTKNHYLHNIHEGYTVCSPCAADDEADVTCLSCKQAWCLFENATTSPTTQPSATPNFMTRLTTNTDLETILPKTTRLQSTSTPFSTAETPATSGNQTVSTLKTLVSLDSTTDDMHGTSTNNFAENQFGESLETTDTISIIAGAMAGASAIAVVVVMVVLVVWTRRRKPKLNGAANDSNFNSVENSHPCHATEHEGPLYPTPNKVTATSSKQKKDNTTHPHVAVIYENASISPGPPVKITAYLDDDFLDETDGAESDPTGGRVEGVYDTYYNTGGLFRCHVTLDTLVEIVAKKTLSDYDDEFKKFPNGLARNYEEALKKENAKKNRYKKVYPYDATRVILKNGGDGDYINASYISTPRGDMAYIAALGPTVAHSEGFSLFWRMVWQENVDKIVVLTKLKEENKMKFERYWPPQGRPETYGRVSVHTVTEENFSEYTIRRFSVSRNSEQRTVYQAHYTAWPDRSVPDNLVSLLDFRHKVQALPSKRIGPVVVHCSAGIGRTGTYIALDLLIHEGQSSGPPDSIGEPSVDVYGCVSALRGQRVDMVQNVEQYRYLHHALVYALTVDTGPIPNCELLTCLSDDGKSRLAHQFKMLQRVLVLRGEDMTFVNKRKNAHKNRPGADIPGVRHRPLLLYQGKSGDTDYINAVYLDGHVDCRKFLVTQTPLQATVMDFLRLVFQEHVHTIVSMDPQHVTDKHDVGLYVPGNNQELKIGSFTVRCTNCETKPYFILRKLSIQNKTGKGTDETTLHQFQFTGWLPGAQVPLSAETLIQTIGEVERIAGQEREPGPIIVHCLTGAERSGLFCTVSLLMEKVINDPAVSVVNTVSQVRDRRSMAIPTVDQYIFCHECIAFSSQSAEYTNVAGTASCDILLTSQSAEYTNVAGTSSCNISFRSQSAEYTNVAGTSSDI